MTLIVCTLVIDYNFTPLIKYMQRLSICLYTQSLKLLFNDNIKQSQLSRLPRWINIFSNKFVFFFYFIRSNMINNR